MQLKNSQFRYALTYVLITFLVLLLLNVYITRMSHRLFSNEKRNAMIGKCETISQEIGQLDRQNASTIAQVAFKHDTVALSRLVVTDSDGVILYDSTSKFTQTGTFLNEAIIKALSRNTYFDSVYHSGVISSEAATPIYSGIVLLGSVYIADEDAQQGSLIQGLQKYTFILSLVLELVIIAFSIVFSRNYSARLKKITESMHTVWEGNYTKGVDMGGNDELTVLGDTFNDLIARLQVSEEKRNNFVSDASHELKTPLASIKLLSDSILQNDMDIATIREFVSDIGNEADRLTRMSDRLLTLSRIDALHDNTFEIVYIAPAIQRVTRMLSQLTEQKNITLTTEITDDCTILVQEDDLYEIIFNLAENAIKYNVVGGTVTISLHREKDNAVLQVRDTGVGIPTEAQSHIFERFFRVDKARSRKSGGSGLGLSIVRNMVERNQGTICVESTVGIGTTFTLTFPVFETD